MLAFITDIGLKLTEWPFSALLVGQNAFGTKRSLALDPHLR